MRGLSFRFWRDRDDGWLVGGIHLSPRFRDK